MAISGYTVASFAGSPQAQQAFISGLAQTLGVAPSTVAVASIVANADGTLTVAASLAAPTVAAAAALQAVAASAAAANSGGQAGLQQALVAAGLASLSAASFRAPLSVAGPALPSPVTGGPAALLVPVTVGGSSLSALSGAAALQALATGVAQTLGVAASSVSIKTITPNADGTLTVATSLAAQDIAAAGVIQAAVAAAAVTSSGGALRQNLAAAGLASLSSAVIGSPLIVVAPPPQSATLGGPAALQVPVTIAGYTVSTLGGAAAQQAFVNGLAQALGVAAPSVLIKTITTNADGTLTVAASLAAQDVAAAGALQAAVAAVAVTSSVGGGLRQSLSSAGLAALSSAAIGSPLIIVPPATAVGGSGLIGALQSVRVQKANPIR